MSWRLLTDDAVGAAEGLATDEALMRSYHAEALEPTLRLYTYRAHCALVGRFQDAAAELDLDACALTGTQVNRRPTGGGAIVMGDRQLGVALVTSMRHPLTPPHARAIIDTFGLGIVRGLARLGIDGVVRGKNDIAVDGRKIAGLGVYHDAGDAVLFHCSLLAGLDIDFMLGVLNIPAAKLSDKAVASVEARITTIERELGRPISVDEVRDHVRFGFEEAFSTTLASGPMTAAETQAAGELVTERYGTSAWVNLRAAGAPTGTSMLKTPGGLVRIAVGLSGRAMKEIMVTGDFMAHDRGVAELEAALRWCIAEREQVADAVRAGIARGGGLEGVSADDVTQAVWQAVIDARARLGASGSCYYPEVSTEQEAATWR